MDSFRSRDWRADTTTKTHKHNLRTEREAKNTLFCCLRDQTFETHKDGCCGVVWASNAQGSSLCDCKLFTPVIMMSGADGKGSSLTLVIKGTSCHYIRGDRQGCLETDVCFTVTTDQGCCMEVWTFSELRAVGAGWW